MRYNNSGRSGFTLRGLAIRAAQSIGLHRDGRHFKLPPLECELRRRLWWVLHSTDARMAEDHGITVAEQEYGGDTQLPANIDDQNVSEATTDLIQSQPRWTEMTFSLIIAEIHKVWVPIVRATAESPDGSRPYQLIKQLEEDLNEKYLQYGDPDIPIQRLGILLGQVLVAKAKVHVRQKVLQMQGVSASSIDYECVQELLKMACSALSIGLRMYNDDLLRGFRWLSSTYTQFHLLTYILWHLCVYPTGPHVDEAWRAVNTHFDMTENDPAWPDPGPKWPMLVQLRAKALRSRNAHVSVAQRDQQTPFVENNPTPMEVAGLPSADAALWDIDNWDFNLLDFPDWDHLAQSIAIVGQEGGN